MLKRIVPRELAENFRNSEDYSKAKVPKIEVNKQIWKSPGTYTAVAKAEIMTAEKKNPIIVVRRMQIEANDLTEKRYLEKILLQKHIWH